MSLGATSSPEPQMMYEEWHLIFVLQTQESRRQPTASAVCPQARLMAPNHSRKQMHGTGQELKHYSMLTKHLFRLPLLGPTV